MIHELLRQYGSIRNIPESELAAIGYKRVHRDGGVILCQKDTDDLRPLRQRVSTLYALEPHELPPLSARYLLRMQRILANKGASAEEDCGEWEEAETDGTRTDPFAHISDFIGYTQSWARGTVAEFKSAFGPYCKAKQAFSAAGIDIRTWEGGIEEWHVEVNTGRSFSHSTLLQRIFGELSSAFRSFIESEVAHPDACLREIATKVDALQVSMGGVLNAVRDNWDRTRLLLHTAIQRARRKGELKGGVKYIGFFHLQRIQQLFSRRTDDQGGIFTLRLAKKSPFSDLDIGNHANCCIGVYLGTEGDEFAGGVGQVQMPRYLLDPATQFLEVWKGRERCGLALLFAAKDQKDRPVLVVNSLELNTKLASSAEVLVDAMLRYLCAYAKAAGFAYAVMGGHDYNTGCQYGELAERYPLEGKFRIFTFCPWSSYNDVGYPEASGLVAIDAVPAISEELDHELCFTVEDARAIFEVVIGPAEYRAAGIAMPEDLPQIPFVFRREVEAFMAAIRTKLGLSEGGRIPAAFVMLPTFRLPWHTTLDWAKLRREYREADWPDSTTITMQTLQPMPLESPQTRGDRESLDLYIVRSAVLLWAHHLGYQISDRTEPTLFLHSLLEEKQERDQPCGLRFKNGLIRQTGIEESTVGYYAEDLYLQNSEEV